MAGSTYAIPNDEDVTADDIHEGTDLSGADLSHAALFDADLADADLSGADLSNADLVGADLSGANLSHSLVGVRLVGSIDDVLSEHGVSAGDVGTPFWGANLSDANLQGACLDGADLRAANLGDAHLESASLEEAKLQRPEMISGGGATIHFHPTNFTDAHLRGAQLEGAELRGADFSDADLSGAILPNASLSDPRLSNADLTGADLHGADFSNADLSGVNIRRIAVDDIRLDDIDSVVVNSDTSVSTYVPLRSGFRHSPVRSNSQLWDSRAQGYEKLRRVFKLKGLDGHHRRLYSYQRRARAKEALRRKRLGQWLGNNLSRVLTGHGVLISRVLIWTALFVIGPTLWYTQLPRQSIEAGALYYSIVTFVTAPPHPILNLQGTTQVILPISRQSLTQGIVLLQTYAGTVLIILLGYVLGNRDPI
ncbi:pentapeptide repeat-containing protein [Haloplanus rubicundus]|uniref:Pentapeptide repeat-containing protein n=1 Tax=Haloplanus rubicundus TaxID=1547898 RepID=A0A345E1G2_9EURY|nr:pentapeptide repeat-containing protein [Haloplanus rubicundus]AXG06034.1 pentapeptide repeat-containing protein [Haloplanus rubicundus]